jgi:hypothetical protein
MQTLDQFEPHADIGRIYRNRRFASHWITDRLLTGVAPGDQSSGSDFLERQS